MKVICYGGNDKLPLFTKTLVKDLESLPRIRAVGVIADSERSPSGRLSAFSTMGEQIGFRGCAADINLTGRYILDSKKFAVSLSPNNSAAGRVEDLILAELNGTPVHSCFIDALNSDTMFGSGGMSEKGRVTVLSAALLDHEKKGRAGARHAFEKGVFNVLAAPYDSHRSAIDFLVK